MSRVNLKPFILEENSDGVLWYYGNIAGYTDGDRVIIDSIFDKQDLRNFIHQETDLPIVVEDDVSKAIWEAQGGRPLKKLMLKIYQPLDQEDKDNQFISLHTRKVRGLDAPNKSNYKVIYEGSIEKYDLEDVWDRFSRCVPSELGGRTLSIADVVEISDGKTSSYYYVDQNILTEIDFA